MASRTPAYVGPVRRVLITAACAALLPLLSSSPSLAAGECDPVKGTLEPVPSSPAVGQETDFLATIIDNRTVVEGSRRITVKGPGGTRTYNPDNEKFKPTASGRYTATYTQTVIACDSFVNDTAGPRTFVVGHGRAATATFSAVRSGGVPGTAALFGYVECPEADEATGDPLTYTVYYELSGKRPTHRSPHLATTDRTGCTGGGRAATRTRKGKRFNVRLTQGVMSMEIFGPARARVLFELTSRRRVLAATRASFISTAKGSETVKRDSAKCGGAPGGCKRWSLSRS